MSIQNSWKNAKGAFHQQLALNQEQLRAYPKHWEDFVETLKHVNISSILDIGCGCGAYYNICQTNFPEMKYQGIDYADEAVRIAKEEWNEDSFILMSYEDLTKDYVKPFEAIHMGALLDVLPNADAALDFILSLGVKYVIISRMKLVNGESYSKSYTAYDEIQTTTYYHSQKVFSGLCNKHGYQVVRNGECYLLIKYGKL